MKRSSIRLIPICLFFLLAAVLGNAVKASTLNFVVGLPEAGNYPAGAVIEIKGQADTKANVFLNGATQLTRQSRYPAVFVGTYTVKEGAQTLSLEARYPNGTRENKTISLTGDKVQFDASINGTNTGLVGSPILVRTLAWRGAKVFINGNEIGKEKIIQGANLAAQVYQFEVTLGKEGPNVLVVEARDSYGNTRKKELTGVGTVPFTLQTPVHGTVFSVGKSILVTGTAPSGDEVWVGGVKASRSGSGFTANYTLKAGDNTLPYWIQKAGAKQSEKTILIKGEVLKLTVAIKTPGGVAIDGYLENGTREGNQVPQPPGSELNLFGGTSTLATVKVDGQIVKNPGPAILFSGIKVSTPASGTKQIVVEATDGVNTIRRTLELKAAAPIPPPLTLSVQEPAAATVFPLGKVITIRGTASAGEEVWVGSAKASRTGTGFTAQYTIKEGDDPIPVWIQKTGAKQANTTHLVKGQKLSLMVSMRKSGGTTVDGYEPDGTRGGTQEALTPGTEVTISGFTNTLATVKVDGVQVKSSGTTQFSGIKATVPASGTKRIIVEALDGVNTIQRTLELKAIAPVSSTPLTLTFTGPEPETVFPVGKSITITGTATTGVEVWVAGVKSTRSGSTFTVPYTVKASGNTIDAWIQQGTSRQIPKTLSIKEETLTLTVMLKAGSTTIDALDANGTRSGTQAAQAPNTELILSGFANPLATVEVDGKVVRSPGSTLFGGVKILAPTTGTKTIQVVAKDGVNTITRTLNLKAIEAPQRTVLNWAYPAEDAQFPEGAQISIGGTAESSEEIRLNGTTTGVVRQGRDFSITYTVQAGINSLRLSAHKDGVQTAIQTRTVFGRTPLKIEFPGQGMHFGVGRVISVTGKASPDEDILIGGVKAFRHGNSFQIPITILENLNHIAAVAMRGAQKMEHVELSVTGDQFFFEMVVKDRGGALVTGFDSKGNTLGSQQPVITGTELTLSGGSSKPVTVTLNGKNIKEPNSTNINPQSIPTSEPGEIQLKLFITDGVKTVERKLKVTIKAPPPKPSLSVDHTVESRTYTVNQRVQITGKAWPNAQVKVAGVPMDVGRDGEFLTFMKLKKGENIFEIEAFDSLSGRFTDKILITVKDTLEPTIKSDTGMKSCQEVLGAIFGALSTKPKTGTQCVFTMDATFNMGLIVRDTNLTSVTINGKHYPVRNGQKFDVSFSLVEGENIFEIFAQDAVGNVTPTQVLVFRGRVNSSIVQQSPSFDETILEKRPLITFKIKESQLIKMYVSSTLTVGTEIISGVLSQDIIKFQTTLPLFVGLVPVSISVTNKKGEKVTGQGSFWIEEGVVFRRYVSGKNFEIKSAGLKSSDEKTIFSGTGLGPFDQADQSSEVLLTRQVGEKYIAEVYSLMGGLALATMDLPGNPLDVLFKDNGKGAAFLIKMSGGVALCASKRQNTRFQTECRQVGSLPDSYSFLGWKDKLQNFFYLVKKSAGISKVLETGMTEEPIKEVFNSIGDPLAYLDDSGTLLFKTPKRTGYLMALINLKTAAVSPVFFPNGYTESVGCVTPLKDGKRVLMDVSDKEQRRAFILDPQKGTVTPVPGIGALCAR